MNYLLFLALICLNFSYSNDAASKNKNAELPLEIWPKEVSCKIRHDINELPEQEFDFTLVTIFQFNKLKIFLLSKQLIRCHQSVLY